ncbi:NUDIX domain-containing protein [Anoxybacillus rupiensis]|uniref:NUDIX domain-containing protein n=1 Tax=Anoxybacteroides rupiense TaxID=311460 RepID=A0ABT5W588_9BACL|nr:NUDIX domain-containing protein [Anoxybacillus rupiensis]MDE8563710.1 NUDIX domain-containing protein [Anoxybacillus rupiensis]
MITKVVQWGEAKVRLTWNPDTQLPPRHLITSAHAFCFQDGKLLLVNLNHRGWDGHMEQGETPTECVKREAYEEGYVRGSCFLLGHIVVDHSANPKWDESSPYPKIGYQVFYRMDIEQVLDFEGKYESVERIFINPNEVIDYYHDWNELYQEILYRAINHHRH